MNRGTQITPALVDGSLLYGTPLPPSRDQACYRMLTRMSIARLVGRSELTTSFSHARIAKPVFTVRSDATGTYAIMGSSQQRMLEQAVSLVHPPFWRGQRHITIKSERGEGKTLKIATNGVRVKVLPGLVVDPPVKTRAIGKGWRWVRGHVAKLKQDGEVIRAEMR